MGSPAGQREGKVSMEIIIVTDCNCRINQGTESPCLGKVIKGQVENLKKWGNNIPSKHLARKIC